MNWTKQQQGLSWKEKLRYELDCIIQRRIRQFSSHKKMIDDYLESLRDEPEHKRKKGELE